MPKLARKKRKKKEVGGRRGIATCNLEEEKGSRSVD